jgi:hypothetical protein
MIKEWLLKWARARHPDFVIGGSMPYLVRWWLIPRNPILNIYIHEFLRSDDDRALHGHPWLMNASWLLEGSYREWSFVNQKAGHDTKFTDRKAGDIKVRFGAAPHRIELTDGPCWTLFITGPRAFKWGFYCPQGWVRWQDFTDARDAGAVGRGCDQ